MDTPQQEKPGPVPSGPPSHATRKPSSGLAVKAGLVIVCLGVVIGVVWLTRSRAAAQGIKPGAGNRLEAPPVPVVAGTVVEKDVPIFLEGLGTVQAFNNVTIRARVDGQLQKVAFVEGQDVHTGDLLAQIDPDPFRTALEQARAKKGQDEAQLVNAREDLKRYGDLLTNEGVTRQVYDTQKALVNQLEAGVKADQAAMDSAQVQLAYTTIVSPIDGRTGLRLVDQGNLVRANDTNGLVTVAQLRPISVVFTLPAQTLGGIQKAVAGGGTLAVTAVDGDNATVLDEGKLAVIDNLIDTTTGTIKLKATFPNAALRLWPGQFVNARLLLTTRKGSAVVPEQVIQRGPQGAFAFVILENQTVEVRSVKVSAPEQGEVVVEEGLRPGERVVVDGQYKLQKGSRVKTAEAAGPGRGGGRGDATSKSGGRTNEPGSRGGKPAGAENNPGDPTRGKTRS